MPLTKPRLHEIDQNRAEAHFNYVAADAPENCAALAASGENRVADGAEIIGGENLRERIDESR